MSFIKDSAKKLLSLGLIKDAGTRAIFMHHDVSTPDSPQHSALYSTTPERFKKQIDFISRHFDLVSLDALFGQRFGGSGRAMASLTFDDGFRSVREVALPYLSSLGIPFSVFVNAQAVEQNKLQYLEQYDDLNRAYDQRVYCDAEDIRALDRAGVLIGNHGWSHRPLSGCGGPTLRTEIVENQQFIEKIIGKPVHHLALPYGKRSHYDAQTIEVSRESGHRFIYSNNPTPFRAGEIYPLHDLIPRIGLTDQDDYFLRFIINRARFKKIDL